MKKANFISETDKKYLDEIRATVDRLHLEYSNILDSKENVILDVAPEIYEGCKNYFKYALVETLDIDPSSNATYVTDLAECVNVPLKRFDLVFCTEVLEHTTNPFLCANFLKKIVKDDGVVVVTTPFNFRIHNPQPDNWRFTEHGLRLIFKSAGFSQIDISEVPSERWLAPIQYISILRK
jgi:hypothetical protein